MPRLLIVSFHAPPSRAVGGLRWWGIAKYLVRRGWQVSMLAEGATDEGMTPAGVTIARLPRALTLQDRYQRMRAARVAAPPVPSGSPATFYPGAHRTTGLISMLREEIGETLRFPDDARGWLMRAVGRGRRLARDLAPEAIISTGPPHSTHIVARAIAAGTGAAHWLDYRDPWGEAQPSSRGGAWLLERVESHLTRSAAGILATTPELVDRIRRRRGGVAVHFVPNGVDDEALPARERPDPARFEVLHLGSLYGARDPRVMIEAMRQWVARDAAGSRDAVLRFVGEVEPNHLAPLRAAADGDLAGHIALEAPVARAEALARLARTHLALVLAVQQPELVPAKLYESVGMGIPTLVVTEPGSASAAAAGRVGAHARSPDDPAGIAEFLAAARDGRLPPAPSSGAPVTHSALAAEVERILLGDRTGPQG